jgi:hypothetical protein
MTVFEIVYPGTWVELEDRDVAFKVQTYLLTIESSLSDAAMAMRLFEQAHEQERAALMRSRDEPPHDAEDEADDLHQLAREHGTDGRAFLLELSKRALEARRSRWRAGELPRAYKSRLPFMYARLFLFSLSTIGRLLEHVSRCEGVPVEARDAVVDFSSAFPTLTALRDSSAHVDERVACESRGRRIDLKPVENQFISAPGGGVLIVEGLFGNRFTGTTAGGDVAEIEVGVESMRRAQQCFQKLLDSLPWSGPGRLYPE